MTFQDKANVFFWDYSVLAQSYAYACACAYDCAHVGAYVAHIAASFCPTFCLDPSAYPCV